MSKVIGQKIRSIRLDMKCNQKEFANKIGATVSALSNWENGRNKPNPYRLRKIAELGNTKVEDLLKPTFLTCKKCGYDMIKNEFNYCPICGMKI